MFQRVDYNRFLEQCSNAHVFIPVPNVSDSETRQAIQTCVSPNRATPMFAVILASVQFLLIAEYYVVKVQPSC